MAMIRQEKRFVALQQSFSPWTMSAPHWMQQALGLWRTDAVGAPVLLHGKSLFELYRLQLSDCIAAVKCVSSQRMAEVEARGLQTLAEAGAPAPRVLSTPALDADRALLILEFIADPGRIDSRRLIADLRRLYAQERAHFGWFEDNFIGALTQRNLPRSSFAEFWLEDRLHPQLALTVASGQLSRAAGREILDHARAAIRRWKLERCIPRLIHGDLWSGNLLPDAAGRAHLIDPSISASIPEQDLAMLALFGSPLSEESMRAIAEESGSPPGFEMRVGFWQCYPLLVHLNLFGSSYLRQLQQAVESFAYG